MDNETLTMLEKREDLRVRSIARLAKVLDVSFEEAERIRKGESKQLTHPERITLLRR